MAAVISYAPRRAPIIASTLSRASPLRTTTISERLSVASDLRNRKPLPSGAALHPS
jgi:hypothetical protein